MEIKNIYTILVLAWLLLPATQLTAQKLKLQESEISFFSEAPLENITAVNREASGLFDIGKGEMALIVPIREFQFEISLMQEHFNEKYMDSEKYPRAIFRARFSNFNREESSQVVEATGSLIIHGVEKQYITKGEIVKDGNAYTMKASFLIELEDHKIKIPKLMWQNIAEELEINVKLVFSE